ncbi:hypothetical protein R1flu_025042 [Riccia fluitans]|uniref:Uncharacterized protein n=1 Tax=Riccia fluitans TaxID=41844 RepID=A0ABD1XWL8_9MARC
MDAEELVSSPSFLIPKQQDAPEEPESFEIPKAPPAKDIPPPCSSFHLSEQLHLGLYTVVIRLERFADQVAFDINSPWAYNELLQQLIRIEAEFDVFHKRFIQIGKRLTNSQMKSLRPPYSPE